MSKATLAMTKRELAQYLSDKWYGGSESSTDWYLAHHTKDQLKEQVEHARGERATSDLTYKYDH